MKCSPKTMLKIGGMLVLFFGVGFIFFPQFQAKILILAPFALYAVCPLAMIVAMSGMKNKAIKTDVSENKK